MTTNNVAVDDIALIVAPAWEKSRGHTVEVVAMATLQMAAELQVTIKPGAVSWLVKGKSIPWNGDEIHDVIIVSDGCLKKIGSKKPDNADLIGVPIEREFA